MAFASQTSVHPRGCTGRIGLVAAVAALALGACTRSLEARTLSADPSTLERVLKKAEGGDLVVLQAGEYGRVNVGGRYSEPLVIDASSATVRGLRAGGVEGLEIRGGTFLVPEPTIKGNGRPVYGAALRLDGVKNIRIVGVTVLGPAAEPGAPADAYGAGNGVMIISGNGVQVVDSRFRGLRNGIVMGRVDDFRLAQNVFEGMRTDGISLGMVHKGTIEDNQCRGTRRLAKDHPDCIQLWSRPAMPPTSDIVIRRNRAEGATQGILMANHTRKGVDDGGFDRITIEDNELNVAFPNAIALVAARESIVRNNVVRTYPGARFRANINLAEGVRRCGNVIAGGAGKPGMRAKKC